MNTMTSIETIDNNVVDEITYEQDYLLKHPGANIKNICAKEVYKDLDAVCVGHDFCSLCWKRKKE